MGVEVGEGGVAGTGEGGVRVGVGEMGVEVDGVVVEGETGGEVEGVVVAEEVEEVEVDRYCTLPRFLTIMPV